MYGEACMSDQSVAKSLPRTVFVAGTGRSGTSWLGKILDSNPLIFYKHEPDNVRLHPWFRGIPSRLEPSLEFDRYRQPFAQAIIRAFWSHSADFLSRPDFPKEFLRPHAWGALNFSMRTWRKVTRGGAPVLRIPRSMFRIDPYTVLLVIKSVVSNLRLTWIHRHFPEIKLVLIVRHPGGYLNSIFTGARLHGWTDVGTKKRLGSTVLPFPRAEHLQYTDAFENGSDFERELIYWIVANETPIMELGDSPSLKIVVYEELCARPVEITEDLFRFIGLPVDDCTRQFLRDSTSQERSGYHDVYKNPVRAANKWRTELTGDEKATVQAYLGRCSLRPLWER
jgi:hypothetical protein